MYFNSIKVRLKLKNPVINLYFDTFQFHKGTIKTIYALGLIGSYLFQFHKGTIKTLKDYVLKLLELNFNSIKVRLKLIKVLIYALGLIFQFHKGTIKTR